MKWIFALLTFAIPLLTALQIPDEIGDLKIELNDANLYEGILKTSKGGVIQGSAFRLQAKHIEYNKAKQTIEANDDIMLVYDKRVFTGTRVTYDVKKRYGILTNGKSYDNLWFIGGDQIEFFSDRSVKVTNAYMTASETMPPDYALSAKELTIKENSDLIAKSTKFRFKKIPLFYLPYYKMNMKDARDKKINYSVTSDKGQGAKVGMRYKFYSYNDLDLFLRFDFRLSKTKEENKYVYRGVGGSFESDFQSSHMDAKLQTKSYMARDTFWNDNDPNKLENRYRFQGLYELKSEDKNTQLKMQYDYISDPNFLTAFPADNFELTPSHLTEFRINHIHPVVATEALARPNINKFQGFKQDLPTVHLGFYPIEFGKSKIFLENTLSTSYLDYDYPFNQLSSFRSMRLQTDQNLYRAFNFRYLTFTPHVAYRGIAYSNSPRNQGLYTNILRYGAKASTSLSRNFTKLGHVFTPYVSFEASRPIENKPHYIFDLRDGYEKINELKVGIENRFFTKRNYAEPRFLADVYALRFIGSPQLSESFAKVGADLELNFPSYRLHSNILYNTVNDVFDEANFGTKWTLNSYFAIGLDFYHRSKYAYRKDDPTNFMLDITQSSQTLLNTPISSPRNLFLAKAELSLPPNWTLRTTWHGGWAMKDQPFYAEYQIDLLRMIDTHWKLRISLIKRVNDIQGAVALSLVSF